MKDIHSVVGLSLGDEGKGVAVDYLCSRYDSDDVIVIRHSGGHQVGHTVKIGDKIHEFRHFGSGTMRGVSTIWSKRCTVSPLGFRQERDILITKKIYPKLFVHGNCPVTTIYDIAYNRAYRKSKNSQASVGVGFASTLIRNESISLKVVDLLYEYVYSTKIKVIANYYTEKCIQEGILDLYEQEVSNIIDNSVMSFKEDIRYFLDNTIIINDSFNPFQKNVVFEANQGILLDKNHGFVPYVTHGTTTNITLKDWIHNQKVKKWYTSRVYSTRHGDGPFYGEDLFKIKLKNTEHESNFLNTYQGTFRYAPLNLDLIKYALEVDKIDFPKQYDNNFIFSCLDQIPDPERIPAILNHKYTIVNVEYLKKLFPNLYVNTSPESKTIKKV